MKKERKNGRKTKKPKKIIALAKEGKRKFTLTTPIVADYIEFIAIREMGLAKKLLPKDCQNEKAFLVKHGYSDKSRNVFGYYELIEGFWKAVERIQGKYKHVLREIGMTGMIKRAEGMTVTKQNLSWGKPVDVKEEIPPDVKACERVIQFGGGIVEDNVNVAGLVDGIRKAAAKLDGEDN
jgi:hypothetical protein